MNTHSHTAHRLSFCVVAFGVVLEHFDMMLAGLFASSLAIHFIGAKSAHTQILLGFVGYGMSFIFRPLGAAFFGIIGDRIGRKPAMLMSLFLMSVATIALGLIPSYQSWGRLATVLFVLCRICQGFSVGGEYGAAMTYAYEAVPQARTTAGALVISATHIGGLMAAFLAGRFDQHFQQLFLGAGLVGLGSLCFRVFLVESRAPLARAPALGELFRLSLENKRAYRRAFVVAAALVFTFYTSIIFLNEVIFRSGIASRSEIFRSNCLMLMVWILLPPIYGQIVDCLRISYKKMMLLGLLGVFTVIFPALFFAVRFNQLIGFNVLQILITVFHSLFCFATPRYLGDQFQAHARNTGISLGYSIGASITAAMTPLVCQGIFELTGSVLTIAIPVMVMSALAAIQLVCEMKVDMK